MDIKVRGVYENGVVYLTEPLPVDVDKAMRREVEVVFDPLSTEEAVMMAEMEKIQAELATLGDPDDDTPEERARRVDLFMKSLDLFPPLSDEDAEAILELNRRPMSMFTLDKQYDSSSD
jgi:tetrahydromethanopterin S-methyltransferase subunit A